MMKKLLGLSLILDLLLRLSQIEWLAFQKIDVNIWPLFPVLLFAFFTLENLLKKITRKCYLLRLDCFMILNAIYDLTGLKWPGYITAGVHNITGSKFLLPEKVSNK